MESKDKPLPGGRRRSTNEEINDALTIESKLQVKDPSGKQMDVRAMLGVRNEDIKDQKLKSVMKDYSLVNSSNIEGSGS